MWDLLLKSLHFCMALQAYLDRKETSPYPLKTQHCLRACSPLSAKSEAVRSSWVALPVAHLRGRDGLCTYGALAK